MSKLYADITGFAGKIISVNVNTSHGSSVSTAQIEGVGFTGDIGDEITIDLGYTDNHKQIFNGYIKSYERRVPSNNWTVMAQDKLIRAVDYFVVPTNPENSFKRHNIDAEDLIEDVLDLAGITDFTTDGSSTSFTFAVTSGVDAEVKLVSAYDFCKTIADIVAWHLYADETGTVHFINRKPYPMETGTPDESQPGFQADSILKTINDYQLTNFNYRESDRDLRNRVVVHGAEDVFAEAKATSPYLPNNPDGSPFYKSIVLISQLIDKQSNADNAADYNLTLYNKLTIQASVNTLGDPDLLARKVIHIDEGKLGEADEWYIYVAEHSWSSQGYVVGMELRK
jgi:hypothetical protein